MTQQLRYGVIGAGMMGQEHLRNIALLPGAVVTALADPHADSIAAATRTLGRDVKVFSDHRDLLESRTCDVLVVATPNDTHTAILEDIFAASKAYPPWWRSQCAPRSTIAVGSPLRLRRTVRLSGSVWSIALCRR